MGDIRHLFSFGPRERFTVSYQNTPPLWWFRIVSFGVGKYRGWHFYVPFLRLTRQAKG